jgi:hypothetical protein
LGICRPSVSCGVSRFIGDMQTKCVLYQATNPFTDKTAAVSVLVKDFEGRPLQVLGGTCACVVAATRDFRGATGLCSHLKTSRSGRYSCPISHATAVPSSHYALFFYGYDPITNQRLLVACNHIPCHGQPWSLSMHPSAPHVCCIVRRRAVTCATVRDRRGWRSTCTRAHSTSRTEALPESPAYTTPK